MSGIPSSGSSVTDGAHGRAIPVVPCAHASTGCGPGAGSVGTITRPTDGDRLVVLVSGHVQHPPGAGAIRQTVVERFGPQDRCPAHL